MEQTLILMFLGIYGFLAVLFYKLIRVEQKISSVTKKETYEPLITVGKFFKQIFFGGVSYGLIEIITNFSTQMQEVKSAGVIFLIAILNTLYNFLKYRK